MNVQQIPKPSARVNFRLAFQGEINEEDNEQNMFVVADLSNFEMRVLADVSEEDGLIECFLRGEDIHTKTAGMMFNVPIETIQYKDPITHEKIKGPNAWMRDAAKAINFGLAYGRGPSSLADELHVSIDEAKELIRKYFKVYPKIQAFLIQSAAFAVRNGYSLTANGRIRYFEFNHSSSKERAATEREAKNNPIHLVWLYRVTCIE